MSPVKLFLSNNEFVLVDADVLPQVRMHKWQAFKAKSGKGIRTYARRQYRSPDESGKKVTVSLSHIISGANPGDTVVYVDGDSTNLQRSNLCVYPKPTWLKRPKPAAHDPLDETWSG